MVDYTNIPKYFRLSPHVFLFTVWSFSDKYYLITNLVIFSEIIATNSQKVHIQSTDPFPNDLCPLIMVKAVN